jgi:hypothetical protein
MIQNARNAGVYEADLARLIALRNSVEDGISKAKTEDDCPGLSSLDEEISKVAELCKQSANETISNDGKRGWITAVSSVALSAAGGFLVHRATRDIQNSELTAAQKAAYEDWMNKVGQHITCYIGGDEAGSYGDMISTSLE